MFVDIMADLSCFERAGKALQDSIQRYLTLAGREDLERWLVSIDSAISEIKNLIENAYLTRGEKQKCQTCMSHFLSMRQQLRKRVRQLQIIAGETLSKLDQQQSQVLQRAVSQQAVLHQQPEVLGGELRQPEVIPEPAPRHNSESPSVSWDNFESAFANRIRSGVITNLGTLDISSFLKEAKPLFVRKISEVLEEHPSIKVNIDLVADFGVVTEGEEATEAKYFSTKNEFICRQIWTSGSKRMFKNRLELSWKTFNRVVVDGH